MVVQCPTCQSRFRIADQKVTDRGVRVRCTSCKNVFPVRKEPSAAVRAQPSPAAPRPALQRPSVSAGLAEPPRLDVDDLFGMAELTGDAPLGDMAKGLEHAPVPAPRPAAKPLPSFDDIDIEIAEDAPPAPPAATRPPTGPQRPPTGPQRPPTGPQRANGVSTGEIAPKPPAPPPDAQEPQAGSIADPFAGHDLGLSARAGPGAVSSAGDKQPEPPASSPVRPEPSSPPAPEPAPAKSLVSSALTGLVGAALALAVLVVAALSGDAKADWLRLGPGDDVVATGVVSGLYDTASGKPVFFVRGRVENRGKKVHGPVRITAELEAEGAPQLRASAIAGAEPTAEEVWSLRSGVDVERLHHALETARGERRLQPGASLPFFAVIADPPADLLHHRLYLKVEPVDAWLPPAAGKDR